MAHLNVPAIQSALKMVVALAEPFVDASGTKLDDRALRIVKFITEKPDVLYFIDFLIDEFEKDPNANIHHAMGVARGKIDDLDITG